MTLVCTILCINILFQPPIGAQLYFLQDVHKYGKIDVLPIMKILTYISILVNYI